MDFTECTISIFKEAAFNANFSRLSEEDYKVVNLQYIDGAGLFLSQEFELTAGINFLQNRLNYISIGVGVHRESLKVFGLPYLPELDYFKQHGYLLFWNSDILDFAKQLDTIEASEKRYVLTLEEKKAALFKIRKKKGREITIKESRTNFIKMLVSLQKLNYKIDEDTTTMEKLSIMVKDNKEVHDNLKEHGTKYS